MTGRSILDGLNAASKAGAQTAPSARFRTKDIAIDNIYRNEDNGYNLEAVEKLAGDILLAGRLLHNLTVIYDPNERGQEYRLVSGERRWLALKYLVESGNDEYRIATCQIIPKCSKEEERVLLVLANSQREKSIADRVFEYETLKVSLEKLRDEKKPFMGRDLSKGKLRSHMAEILQEADGTLAALEKISSNLHPALRDLMERGQLNYAAASVAAGLDQEQQMQLAEIAEAGKPVTAKEAKATKERSVKERLKQRYEENYCYATGSLGCDNAENLASFYKDGATVGCGGCCYMCLKKQTCEKCCKTVRQQLEEAEEMVREAREAQEQREQENRPARTEHEMPDEHMEETAHPTHASSLCYSCVRWGDCTEKSDRVQKCDIYKNPVEEIQPEDGPVEIVTPSSWELFRTARGALNTCLIGDNAGAILALIDAMWIRWEETGGWKNE